jgi:serine phosphatase RsbU (regulator of sigma subunit)
MKSLKGKFILVITFLIIGVILLTSGVLVNQKRLELQQDIYLNARNFADLSHTRIIELVEGPFADKNFLFFSRDLNALLKSTPDVSTIQIYSFAGELLFDSKTETNQFYKGPARPISDPQLLQQVKSAYLTVQNSSSQSFSLEKIAAGNYEVITSDNQRLAEVEALKNFRSIEYIVKPIEGKYSIVYYLTYQNLLNRLWASAYQIILIGLGSILASIFVGFILSSVVTNPLKKLTQVVLQIAKGDFTKRAEVKSEDEVGVLAESVNQMAQDLEASTEARIYKEKVKKELEIAAKIQKDLLPQNIPNIPGLDLAGIVIPASEVGGDVYDILFDANQTPYFYVGDVTGHGVPAGLLSSVANAIITSTVDYNDLKHIVSNLNHVLKQKSASNLFLTLLLARYQNKKIDYISAGHEQIIYFNAKTQTAEFLAPGGIALGLFEDIADKLETRQLDFKKGDCILLYTDGIPEAFSSETEQFGNDLLIQVATEIIKSAKSAEQIKSDLVKKVTEYMGTYPQKDDITLLVIRAV